MSRLSAALGVILLWAAPSSNSSQHPGETTQSIVVINAGVPGQNTTEIRARLDPALAEYHPSFVILYGGVNDAFNEPKFLPMEDTVRNLAWMAEEARAHQATPILVVVQHLDAVRLATRHGPRQYGPAGANGRVDDLDRRLLQMAAEHHIPTADFRGALDRAGGPTAALSTDGSHLTPQGYGLLAATVRAALPSHLEAGTVILCLGDSLTYGTGVRPPDTANGQQYPTYPAQLQTLLRAGVPADQPKIHKL